MSRITDLDRLSPFRPDTWDGIVPTADDVHAKLDISEFVVGTLHDGTIIYNAPRVLAALGK